MVLSDRVIKTLSAEGKIVVEPLGEGCIQPASVDFVPSAIDTSG